MPIWQVDNWIGNAPARTAPLWRYMSRRKLEDLLAHPDGARFYLARLDTQEDDAEGRWPANAEQLLFTGSTDGSGLREALETERMRTYTSCWTMRRDVCPRMWVDYGAADGAAAVVKFGDLFAALDGASQNLAAGGVIYRDSIDSAWTRRHHRVNTLVLPFQKRTEYSWEQEVRVVHQRQGEDPPVGLHVEISLELLKPRFCIGPAAKREEVVDLIRTCLPDAELMW